MNSKSLEEKLPGQALTQSERLAEPFDEADISWKPQTVDYTAKTALAVAYADPRAYVDRLNSVFGVGKWSDDYQFLATPFTKLVKGKKAYKEQPATEDKLIPGNKLVVTATIEVPEYSIRISSTGDSDASDDNAATSAEAQAFKRAAMKLGLGRYLYELPKISAAFNYGKWTEGLPSLPDWALPKAFCQECTNQVKAIVMNERTFTVSALLKNSQAKYNKNLCADCQKKKTESAKVVKERGQS